MDASSELHAPDLSTPSSAWLERLLGFKNLEAALENLEGPRLFADVSSLEELRGGLGLDDFDVLHSPHSRLPRFLESPSALVYPRDPIEWDAYFAGISGTSKTLVVYVQNPQFYDGLTISPELFVRFLEALEPAKKIWERVVLVCDETLGDFSWELSDEAAQIARLPASVLAGWESYVCFRLEFLQAPNAAPRPALFWPVPKSPARWRSGKELIASPVAWKLLQHDLNQGIELVRFRHLSMRNLKLVGNALSPFVARKKIEVEHWPLSGFHMSFKVVGRQNEDPELLIKRLERQGFKLYPRSPGPGFVSFSFLVDHLPLGEGLKRLVASLELL
jgi:hypothetical protein